MKVDRSILAWEIPRLGEGDETLALRLQTLEALEADSTHVILNRVGLTKLKTSLVRRHFLYSRRNIVVLDFLCAFFTKVQKSLPHKIFTHEKFRQSDWPKVAYPPPRPHFGHISEVSLPPHCITNNLISHPCLTLFE